MLTDRLHHLCQIAEDTLHRLEERAELENYLAHGDRSSLLKGVERRRKQLDSDLLLLDRQFLLHIRLLRKHLGVHDLSSLDIATLSDAEKAGFLRLQQCIEAIVERRG